MFLGRVLFVSFFASFFASVLIACGFFYGALAVAAPIKERASLRLLVMSYNIKGLPSLITSDEYSVDRFEKIGELLAKRRSKGSAPAIVLLQEAFSEDIRALLKAAKYPAMAQGPEFKSFVGLDSGLYVLSEYPIIARAHREFGAYPMCSGWDCFANKGVQFARIEVPGFPRPLDIFNTHLQAGREDPPARAKQVEALLSFFSENHTPGNPVIFGGDFNLRPKRNQSVFEQFVQGSGLHNAGLFCVIIGCARSPDTGWQGVWENAVDHQFYSTRGEIALTPITVERTYAQPIDGLRLSDHAAHEVSFEAVF